jgi:sacsin
VSIQPHIFSNGYQIKFNEEPAPECRIGYIVPEWAGKNQTLIDLNNIYGSGKSLPTTIIVLPLKEQKVAAVRKELSDIHPEILLSLFKIKKLSVREISTMLASKLLLQRFLF